MRALTQHMHPIQVFRLQAPFFPFAVSFHQRRAALLLATALTGSLVLMPALTTQVRASEIINGTDETVIGTGVGTLPSTWDHTGSLAVGRTTTGTLTISEGGTVNTLNNGVIGYYTNAQGTVTVDGADSTWTMGADLRVGSEGHGTLVISNGGAVSNTQGYISFVMDDGGTGAVTVTGLGSAWTNTDYVSVGYEGTGTLTISDRGTVTSTGNSYVGSRGTGTATVTGAGSKWTNTGNIQLGFKKASTLTIADGGEVSASNLLFGNPSIGTLNIGAASGSAAVAAGTLSAATVSFGRTGDKIVFNHTDTDYTFAAAISGAGSVNVLSGTTKLTGTNTYSGGTTISAGTLQIGDGGTTGSLSGNVTNNSALVVNRSDALSYTGDISGTGSLTKSGTGTLTLTGANSHTGGTTISGGTLQIGNGGTVGSLSGNVTNNGAMIFNRSDALTYGGDISGTGSLTKSGAETLTLTGTNTYTGGTTISAGTLQVGDGGSLTGDIVNNSAMAFNSSTGQSLSSVLSGTGTLTKSGTGTVTLTGTNTYSGGTTVSAGKLVVNGSTGAITLNGGTLGGSGTVGNVTANSGSTIAPGNSIGTLNVTGNTSFAAGSTYAVEVDSAGNSDKIAATGTATIDSGATVSVSAENGTDDGSRYAVSTTYTILTANTGVTGTFGSVSENFAFLDASLSYDVNNVYLKLLRNNFSFASSATTANQRATAGALDTLGSGSTVYDVVSVLSAANARSAFDSLSGEIYASTTGLFIHNSQFARNAVGNRIRSAFEGLDAGSMPVTALNARSEAPGTGGAEVWSHAYGSWGKTGGNGNAAAMDHNTGGFFFGADTDIAGGWHGGLMAGYGNAGFDVGARTSSGNADSYTLGAYTGGQFGSLGLQLGASYALHDVSTSRNVTFGTLSNALSADYTASTTQFFGEAGYSFETQIARFEPFAGFAMIHQHNSGFTETGGAAALSVASASQTLGVTTLGLRAGRQVAAGDAYTASLNGSLGWRHAFGALDPASSMRFASGNAFTVAATPLDRDTALIEAGFKLDFDGGATVNLDYQGHLGAKTQSHGLAARFSKSF